MSESPTIDWEGPDGTWRVVIHLTDGPEGRSECKGFELHPTTDAQRVTATVVRALPIGRLIASALAMNGDEAPEVRPDLAPGGAGRPPLEESHFALVARAYAWAWVAGVPNPTQFVADRYGVSHSTAAKWVAKSRRLGLLEATRPGVPGGTLTEKGTDVVQDTFILLQEEYLRSIGAGGYEEDSDD